ncbi:hypothetical protein HanIR_Chr10g0496181 [Helianthus annuus]|nr:hypothetical protein HanIR_Chr10g0496181 [Helianthus annuus]
MLLPPASRARVSLPCRVSRGGSTWLRLPRVPRRSDTCRSVVTRVLGRPSRPIVHFSSIFVPILITYARS